MLIKEISSDVQLTKKQKNQPNKNKQNKTKRKKLLFVFSPVKQMFENTINIIIQ